MTRAPAELRLVADRAARALGAAGAPEPGDGVAVAVSGGADSSPCSTRCAPLPGRAAGGWPS